MGVPVKKANGERMERWISILRKNGRNTRRLIDCDRERRRMILGNCVVQH